MFIQGNMVLNMVLAVDKGIESKCMAMLWLVSYTFLLRVPSEALPMVKGDAVIADASCEQSVLYLANEVWLRPSGCIVCF